VRLGESDSDRIQPVLIDIEGKDLSFLIGRKAETINALQFITSLIVGRELGRWVPLQIDVQHYRRRREDELRKLARRIADQVISTGRNQALEPMPPNERRIIHLELSDHPEVETESEGEDPKRKVVVRLKM
jgi:spoIIIJ-associated protein